MFYCSMIPNARDYDPHDIYNVERLLLAMGPSSVTKILR